MAAEVTAEPAPVSPAEPVLQEPQRTRPRDPEHARVVGARRRLLGMLLALAIGAGVLAFMKLAAWWVILPPMVMLFGYIALLREASRADAERRWSGLASGTGVASGSGIASGSGTGTASAERGRGGAAPVRAPVVPLTPPPAPDAEIIDITARVSDEPYDQIAEAKLRAVGD